MRPLYQNRANKKSPAEAISLKRIYGRKKTAKIEEAPEEASRWVHLFLRMERIAQFIKRILASHLYFFLRGLHSLLIFFWVSGKIPDAQYSIRQSSLQPRLDISVYLFRILRH